jgi:Trk-type K+ transport system membrane component
MRVPPPPQISLCNGGFFIYQSLIIKNMKKKKIKMEPTEFYHFRKLAFAMSLAFGCTIAHGVYIVEASIDQLEKLGY